MQSELERGSCASPDRHSGRYRRAAASDHSRANRNDVCPQGAPSRAAATLTASANAQHPVRTERLVVVDPAGLERIVAEVRRFGEAVVEVGDGVDEHGDPCKPGEIQEHSVRLSSTADKDEQVAGVVLSVEGNVGGQMYGIARSGEAHPEVNLVFGTDETVSERLDDSGRTLRSVAV